MIAVSEGREICEESWNSGELNWFWRVDHVSHAWHIMPLNHDVEGNRELTSVDNCVPRHANVRQHQDKVLAEILVKEELLDNATLGETKLPISGTRGIQSHQEGGYRVREDATHVTIVRESENRSVAWEFFKDLFAGGGAGAITKTAVAPLERVKILLQVQGMNMKATEGKLDKTQFKYRGVLGTAKTVLSEEGFLALYAGNGANVLRVVPVYALKFSFNNQFKDLVRKPGEELSFAQLILAGTMAGLFQTCMTYPLETVRTRLSLGLGMGSKYNGIVDVFRQTIKSEGVSGLYKGIGPTFVSGSPYVGLQMSFYEVFKRSFDERDSDTSIGVRQLEKLIAGAAAGLIAQTLTYPGDTIRRRMQMNGMNGEAKTYRNSWDCILKLCRAEGVVGLFNGLGANLIRAIPGAAIQFWAYDLLCSVVSDL